MNSSKKRGLGRGLDVLLSKPADNSTREQTSTEQDGELHYLPVEYLQRGQYQPRKNIRAEELQPLADSIRTQGVIQPIVVRPLAENRYEIVAGERRWRAAQLAGLGEVPALVREIPDNAALAIALIENIQRENLNPIEEAQALERLQQEFELSHQQIAEAVGRSRAAVTNLLRLLNLNPDVREKVEQGHLEMGHARALLAVPGQQQSELARRVISGGLSVRQTEALARRATSPEAPKQAEPTYNPDLEALQQRLSDTLGAAVQCRHRNSGQGQLVIKYNSLEELDGILAHIK
ncbi:MAG: ParB/RepB/Spo0J family partition protein [Gammaproteobacteria bacterium]|nr:ParB/RepB/Spo0J family partition protein [Gammaproteobacteria bacterium]